MEQEDQNFKIQERLGLHMIRNTILHFIYVRGERPQWTPREKLLYKLRKQNSNLILVAHE